MKQKAFVNKTENCIVSTVPSARDPEKRERERERERE
jgi:hypothetical protein